VASYQLHSTLDLSEVIKIVVEIVINLIGAEVFAIYVLDERRGLRRSSGVEREQIRVKLGEGTIGRSRRQGSRGSRGPHARPGHDDRPRW
jgi:signal transduction protein with GAF and PtsI domain